jgi:spermidine synthase
MPEASVSRGRLYACFFASGAAALILEIVWSKYLSYLLGNSTYGVATVVAAFLGGLGLGAALGGRLAARAENPLALYGRLEALVGLLAISSPLAYLAAPAVFSWVYQVGGGMGAGFFALRFAVLFGALLLPATAMGATLPLLVEHFDRAEAERARRATGSGARRATGSESAVARLYALNTLGAVTGVLAAGFALLPRIGLAKTAIIAGGIDFAVAAAILGLKPGGLPRPAERPVPNVAGRAVLQSPPGLAHAVTPKASLDRAILPLMAVSGLTAILYQVAWTRILTIPFGGMIYAFSVILAVYLLGLALGAAGAARALHRTGSPAALFGVLQLGLAASVACGTQFLHGVPHAQASAIAASDGSMARLLAGEAVIAALLVLPPTLFLGALFPVAVEIRRRGTGDAGPATGSVYAANTAGSITGSILTAFLLIPSFGSLQTILGAAAVNLGLGAGALLFCEGAPAWRRAGAAASLVGAAAFTVAWMPEWDAERMSLGFVRLLRAHWFGGESLTHRIIDRVGASPELERLLFYKEGRVATVTVVESQGIRALLINGKTDATTGQGADMRTQVLVGQIPLLAAPRARDVFIVGYGSGVTAHAVLTHAVRDALTVELEEAVVEAAPFFEADAKSPLADPRSRLMVEDAQTLLRSDRKTYDVIVSEPSNLWIAGMGSLFTREFYQVAAARLRPGGIFCQWVQCYQISPEAVRTIFRTLATRFPHGQLFYIDSGADLIVVASADRDVPLDAAAWASAMARPEVAADLARAGVQTFADLLRYYRGRLERVAAEAGDGPVNTSDNGWLEHRAPFDLIASERSEHLLAWTPAVARDLIASLSAGLAVRPLLRDAAARAEAASDPEAARGLRMALEQLPAGHSSH